MSDIYIPELIELDSYWQKAVEDAICDTLKGEKRLHCALRNRKKINQKLEKLGLKHVYSQTRFSSYGSPEFAEEQEVSESDSEHSRSSGNGSKEVDPHKSRSRSKNHGDPPFGDKHKNPERPLLGNGSLEKMKKSQNSFNCEPMGVENLNEELSESEKEKDLNYVGGSKMSSQDERNKKVQWLHVRDDTDFEDSDAESAEEVVGDEDSEKNEFRIRPFKNKNNFTSKKKDLRSPQKSKKRINSKVQKKFSAHEDLFSKNLVKNPSRQSSCPQQRLALALAKRERLKNKSLSIGSSNMTLGRNQSSTRVLEKRKNNKKHSSPFIKFYLEVDRKLCHKHPLEQITKEAAKRWRAMNNAQKSDYSKTRQMKAFKL